jgi:hypothetical protein
MWLNLIVDDLTSVAKAQNWEKEEEKSLAGTC